MLVGRTKISEKGVFSFDIQIEGKKIKIHATHLNLDYTLITKKSKINGKTSILETGYDDTKFIIDALSDHRRLLSRFAMNTINEEIERLSLLLPKSAFSKKNQ